MSGRSKCARQNIGDLFALASGFGKPKAEMGESIKNAPGCEFSLTLFLLLNVAKMKISSSLEFSRFDFKVPPAGLQP